MNADSPLFPQGIEVLVKKAAVDLEFRALLLERRAEAAAEIGLELSPSEAAILRAVPADQLEAIIDRTHVPDEHRRAFLGQVAAVMLAALGSVTTIGQGTAEGGFGGFGGVRPHSGPTSRGVRPDWPKPKPQPAPKPTVAQRLSVVLSNEFPKFARLQVKAKQEAHQQKPPAPPPQPPAAEGPPAQDQQAKAELLVPRGTRLVEDLGAKPAQRVTLRKRLEKEFKISIHYGDFGQLKTVGDVLDYVEKAVVDKELAEKGLPRPKRPRNPPERPPVSGGIRPR